MTRAGLAEDTTFRYRVRARAEELALFRHALRGWLRRAGLGEDLVFDVALVASEACANAIEHPVRRGEPHVDVDVVVRDGEVRIAVADTGTWRTPEKRTARGRGLLLIRGLMDAVEIGRSPTGTTLRASRALAMGSSPLSAASTG